MQDQPGGLRQPFLMLLLMLMLILISSLEPRPFDLVGPIEPHEPES